MKIPWFIIDPNNLDDVDEITAEDCEIEVPKGFMTFQEWSEDGFKIMKGSKAHWFNGIAYFSPAQVVDSEENGESIYWGELEDEEPFIFDGYWDY